MKKFIFIILLLGLTGCGQQEFIGGGIQYVTAPENNTYKIGQMNYESVLKEDIDSEDSLKYKIDDTYIAFKPVRIKWDTTSIRSINRLENVKATIDEKKYLYKDALGKGVDIDMNFGDRVWEKIVKINSLNDLGNIPKAAKFLEIEFAMHTNMVIDGWDGVSRYYVNDTIRIGDYSYFEPAIAWDSQNEVVCEEFYGCKEDCDVDCKSIEDDCDFCECKTVEKCEDVKNEIKIESYFEENKYVKRIPVEWLKTAQYPIYTDADITYGTATEFESGVTLFTRVTKINEDKFVVCYMDDSDGDAGKCVVATVSDTTITFGTISEFDSNIKVDFFGAMEGGVDVCEIDTDKFIVVYSDDDSGDDGYAVAVTVSGTTIGTWGTAVELETGDAEQQTCAQLDTDKFASCYNDESNSDTATCVAATVSGTTITGGTPTTHLSGSTDYNSRYVSAMGQLGTDKFVYCFPAADDSNDGQCVVATVSGTTITTGAVAEFNTADTRSVGLAVVDTDKFVVGWAENSPTDGWGIAGTVSGTTISYGTKARFETDYAANTRVSEIDATHVIVVNSDGTSAPGDSRYTTVDWADSSLSYGSEINFETGNTGGLDDAGLDIATISNGKIVICFQDDSDSDKGKCIIGDAPYSEEEESTRRIIIIH